MSLPDPRSTARTRGPARLPRFPVLLLALLPGVLAGLLLAGTAAAPPASAARPVIAQPVPGATLKTAPFRVRLTFPGIVQRGSVVEVDGPAGSADAGGERITGPTVTQPLASGLAAGTYTVRWHVRLRGGDDSNGKYTFTVTGERSESPAPAPTTPRTTSAAAPTSVPTRTTAEPSPRRTPATTTDTSPAAIVVPTPAAPSVTGTGKGDVVLGVLALLAAIALASALVYGWRAGWWRQGPAPSRAPAAGPAPDVPGSVPPRAETAELPAVAPRNDPTRWQTGRSGFSGS